MGTPPRDCESTPLKSIWFSIRERVLFKQTAQRWTTSKLPAQQSPPKKTYGVSYLIGIGCAQLPVQGDRGKRSGQVGTNAFNGIRTRRRALVLDRQPRLTI